MANEYFPNDELKGNPAYRSWPTLATVCTIVVVILLPQIVNKYLPLGFLSQGGVTSILANFILFHISGLITIVLIVTMTVLPGDRLMELKINQPFSFSVVRYSLLTTILVIPVVEVVYAFILIAMDYFQLPLTESPIVEWLQTSSDSVVFLLVFGAVILAPIAEELMFRLVFYKTLATFLDTKIATVLTSLLFATFHLIPEQMIPLFILALVLQRSLKKTDNLWVPILIHSLFNSFAVSLALLYR